MATTSIEVCVIRGRRWRRTIIRDARAQLFLGEDGRGNLRLRDGSGTVRDKLGATPTGAGLILFDQDVEPAIWASTDRSSTSLMLAAKGKAQRLLKP